jgi:hypothetical protein
MKALCSPCTLKKPLSSGVAFAAETLQRSFSAFLFPKFFAVRFIFRGFPDYFGLAGAAPAYLPDLTNAEVFN